MPTLRFHGVQKENIIGVAPEIFDQLTKIYEIPQDYLNVEIDNSIWISRDGEIDGFPMVEILAFRRDAQTERRVAEALDSIMIAAGYPESEVFFVHLEPKSYYSAGKPF